MSEVGQRCSLTRVLMVSRGAGVSLSGDATFKVTKKAAVVNAKKQHLDLIGGGCFTILNEDTKIIKWVRVTGSLTVTAASDQF